MKGFYLVKTLLKGFTYWEFHPLCLAYLAFHPLAIDNFFSFYFLCACERVLHSMHFYLCGRKIMHSYFS